MESLTFLHTGSIGDCWAAIPAMKQASLVSGKKVILYLEKDREAFYYEGATHPTRDAENKFVMLNETVINMMIPLFMAQPFIEDVRIWNNEPVNFDLNKIRDTYVGMPSFSINRWYFYVYPNLACDLTKQWMEVPDAEVDLAKGKIIVTRSERYQNEYINYKFLEKYKDEVLFCGTNKEYNLFKLNNDVEVGRLEINNFLELSQAIKQSLFHISNQTQAFQISEGLRHPRIIELCGYAPNVLVHGEDAYDFFAQIALELYVDVLYKKHKNPAIMQGESIIQTQLSD